MKLLFPRSPAVTLMALAVMLTSGAAPMGAQDAGVSDTAALRPADRPAMRGPDRLTFATSAAWGSPPSGWLGRTPGRDVFITSFRATWSVAGKPMGASVGYFAELLPLAIVKGNPTSIQPLRDCVAANPEWHGRTSIPAIEYFERCATRSEAAVGGGITPIGLSARFSRASGVSLNTDISGGAIMFDKRMPYPNTAKLNYLLTAGTSLEFPLRRHSVLSLGYQMHHISNAGTGEFNPGILAHAIQLGWSRRR